MRKVNAKISLEGLALETRRRSPGLPCAQRARVARTKGVEVSKFCAKPLKMIDYLKEVDLDLVPLALEFVLPELNFVPANLDFVSSRPDRSGRRKVAEFGA
jgi:hypothetical protein